MPDTRNPLRNYRCAGIRGRTCRGGEPGDWPQKITGPVHGAGGLQAGQRVADPCAAVLCIDVAELLRRRCLARLLECDALVAAHGVGERTQVKR